MKRERIEEIAELLDKRGKLSLEQLEEYFPKVSQMTLRRDLFQLEEEGKIIRVRGGAMSVKEVQKSSGRAVHEKDDHSHGRKDRNRAESGGAGRRGLVHFHRRRHDGLVSRQRASGHGMHGVHQRHRRGEGIGDEKEYHHQPFGRGAYQGQSFHRLAAVVAVFHRHQFRAGDHLRVGRSRPKTAFRAARR